MSVEYIKRLAGPYVGDGTGQKTFSFGFLIFEESDVYVAVAASSDSEPSDLQQGTDYTVSMNADQSATPGGTITLTSETGLAKDAVLVIGSAVDYTQTLDLTNYTRFAPELITTELDRIVVMIQQIVELLGRVVQVPQTSSISPSDLFYQLLNAAESAAQSAEDAAASLAACEQIRQLIEQYSWDIPHIVNSLRDVEDYPYDGLFAVGGYGDPGRKGQNISNRYVKAESHDEMKVLGQWADDVIANREKLAEAVRITDFGGIGDGETDCSDALADALEKSDKVFLPEGTFVLDELPDFSKILGVGSIKVGDQVLPCGEVVSPLTIDYPGQFGSFEAIFNYLSFRRLSALVTINVVAGTHSLTEQITHSHPDGDRIHIVGQGTTESVLRFTLPAASSQAGVYMKGPYRIGLIDNLTLDGNEMAGYSNDSHDPIGVYASQGASVVLGENCKVVDFARNGLFACFGGSIVATNVTVAGTGSDAFCATQNGTLYCNGATADKNMGVGFLADYGGCIWGYGIKAIGTKQREGVGGIGISAMYGATIYATNATIEGTAYHGIDCAYGAFIYANGASVSNSGRAGALCRATSSLYLVGAEISGSATNGIQVQENSTVIAGNVSSSSNSGSGAQVLQGGLLVLSDSPSFTNNGAYGLRCYQEGRIHTGGLSVSEICTGNTSGAYSGTLQTGSNTENSLIYAAA